MSCSISTRPETHCKISKNRKNRLTNFVFIEIFHFVTLKIKTGVESQTHVIVMPLVIILKHFSLKIGIISENIEKTLF